MDVCIIRDSISISQRISIKSKKRIIDFKKCILISAFCVIIIKMKRREERTDWVDRIKILCQKTL